MTEREATSERGGRSSERVPPWLLVLAGVTLVLAIAVVWLLVVPTERDHRDAAQRAEAAATTIVAPTTQAPVVDPDAPVVPPEGAVAYIDAGGQVLVGNGADPPVAVAADAAVDEHGVGAVAVAPTSDVLAYVRSDGALVMESVPGAAALTEPMVLATDVALDALSAASSLAWDPTGLRVAYLAVGTQEMVEPRPEQPPPLSGFDVFRVPLPEGVLGNVIKVVDRDGAEVARIGDPSTRSMVAISTSRADDLMLVESVAPDTGKPYTISLATTGSSELMPTVLSADDPDFAPDGSFAVMVGPAKGGQELIRVDTLTLDRAVLVQRPRICSPRVSPDSSRIVYATGSDCDTLELVSSLGGRPVDITPPQRPGRADYSVNPPTWTTDGHHLAISDCRVQGGAVTCGLGPVQFLDPDRRSVLEGIDATTVRAVEQAAFGELRLDLVMAGPVSYEVSYPVTSEVLDQLADVEEDQLALTFDAEESSISLDLRFSEGRQFTTGTMTVTDASAGLDRTFLVIARSGLLGVRVATLDGIWISTGDLPVASGEFRLAIRRV